VVVPRVYEKAVEGADLDYQTLPEPEQAFWLCKAEPGC